MKTNIDGMKRLRELCRFPVVQCEMCGDCSDACGSCIHWRRMLDVAIADARAAGYAEAIERAAKVCEDGSAEPYDWGQYYAETIRELAGRKDSHE